MPPPILTTSRLRLRAFCPGDWDPYAAMMADPELQRYVGGKVHSRDESWASMAYFLGVWELRGYGMFAVEHEGRFAGRVGIYHPPDWAEPELGWTIAAPFWGQGLATEAAGRVRDWAFVTFGWDHLVSYINPANTRSIRVAEKLGAAKGMDIELRGTTVLQWVHQRPAAV